MNASQILECCTTIASTFKLGTRNERDVKREKFNGDEERTTVLPVRPIPGVEPSVFARSPGFAKRCSLAVNADDLAQDATLLVLKRWRRIDLKPVPHPTPELCRLAVLASYRHIVRTLQRERMNLAPAKRYFKVLMPTVPERAEESYKCYGERPNVPRSHKVTKLHVVQREGGSVQCWLVTIPFRPVRPAYVSIRKTMPSDGVLIKEVIRGYSRPDKIASSNRVVNEIMEELGSDRFDPRTKIVLNELSKYDRKNGKLETSRATVAAKIGIHVSTVSRIVSAVRPYVLRTDLHVRGDELPEASPSSSTLNFTRECTNATLSGTFVARILKPIVYDKEGKIIDAGDVRNEVAAIHVPSRPITERCFSRSVCGYPVWLGSPPVWNEYLPERTGDDLIGIPLPEPMLPTIGNNYSRDCMNLDPKPTW